MKSRHDLGTIRGLDENLLSAGNASHRSLLHVAKFVEDEDRESFLVRMGNAADEYGVKVYLFCLMRNHVHLLLETPQGNLSAFMHKLQTAYTVWFNRRRRRSGHLMQGRFGSILVEGDEYLLKLSRYIHLNPVCVKTMLLRPARERVAVLRAYAWSSYRGYAGLAKPYGFVTEASLKRRQYGCVERAAAAWLLGRCSGMNHRDIFGHGQRIGGLQANAAVARESGRRFSSGSTDIAPCWN